MWVEVVQTERNGGGHTLAWLLQQALWNGVRRQQVDGEEWEE